MRRARTVTVSEEGGRAPRMLRRVASPYLCTGPLSSAGPHGAPGLVVAVGGACARWMVRLLCARPPSLILVREPAVRRLGDMMVDGVIPLREVALRPLGLSGPSTRTWRQENAGSRPRCIGDGGAARAERVLCGRQPLLSEFAECVVAAFEQLAHDPEQGAVAAELLGGRRVEGVVWRAGPPRCLGGFV